MPGELGFPLSISADRRFLVDGAGLPFLLNGDTAWSLIVATDRDGVIRYLDDRRKRGFNAIVVNLIERLFAPDPPRNVFGDDPFADIGRLVGPNERYFAHARWVVEQAGARGFLVLLAPAYLGYVQPSHPGFGGAPEGWFAEVLATGVKGCVDYGQFVGRLFADTPNLMWVMAGDRNPGEALEHVRAMARAIAAEHKGGLFTAHVHPDDKAADEFPDDEWLTVNQTYSYSIVHRALLDDYDRLPVRPNFLFETSYEREHNSSELQIRRQAYWALTRGAFGHVFGAYPIWRMASGWEDALDSTGARQMQHVPKLFEGLPWWKLVPDRNHELVVDGRGEFHGLDLCTAACTSDRRIAVAYLPTARRILVDFTRMGGSPVLATWFCPLTGERIEGGMFDGRARSALLPPADHDWALILTAEDVDAGAVGEPRA